MTDGYRVVCSDGESRHESLFRTRQDAETWQTRRHVCYLGHRIRREAEWDVAAMRIRRRPHLNLPSIRSRELADEGPPTEITVDLTDGDLASVGGEPVGTGALPSSPSTAPDGEPPAPVPASYRTVLAQAFGEVGRRAPSGDGEADRA